MSEQIGEPVGHGNSRMAGEDVAIHFDTTFNVALMAVRTLGLAIVAWWIFASWGAKPLSVLLGGGLLVFALGMDVKDYQSMQSYRLEVAEGGLTLRVPPELDELIEWRTIESLELEGFGYARIGVAGSAMPFQRSAQVALELPDWKTMTLVANGKTYEILLDELSIEHRQIFAKALIKRAGLVEEK